MVAGEKVGTESMSDHNASVLTARIAGLLYLMIIACGIFSEIYVRMNLIVPRDAQATTVKR
jgi:hypothetical protein